MSSIPRKQATTTVLPVSEREGSYLYAHSERSNNHDTHAKRHAMRNEAVAFLGEFAGTFMFLFMAFTATQIANNVPKDPDVDNPPRDVSALLYISFAFGLSLAINVWAFFRISGGMFNPAVTLALTLAGAVKPLRAVSTICAQLVGGIAAAAVVAAITPDQLAVSTTLSYNTSLAQGFFLELFLTAQLVFVILMLAVEKHKSTPLAPLGIGFTLFICELAGVFYTGGSLNPARTLGPSVVVGFDSKHWVYWAGPCAGAILSFAVWRLLKYLNYETANPGQDHDGVVSV